MRVGERIKSRRKEIGLSAEQVAKELGVSPATVYRYESNDIMNMRIDKLEPIAKALRTTPAYLMGWEDDKKENTPTESQRILESVNSSENVDLLLHIIKNEASLSREQLLKLQGFVSALEAENK
jgi:transcriptional regulator with XRE-family HTH domain|nr:MAG TPA: helix-turn-helix domain protein [Caudoviricetes sp.]